MKCSNCGKEIADESQFCEFCGANIKRKHIAFPTGCLNNKWLWLLFAAVIVVLFLICLIPYHKKARECVTNIYNDYEYVDLGLSVKWATCDVGAYSPFVIGDYYTWEWEEENSLDYKDIAHKSRGGLWRTPTRLEFIELLNNCEVIEGTLQNKSGLFFYSKIKGYKNQHIFLPCNNSGRCSYWTSSLSETNSQKACAFLGGIDVSKELSQRYRDSKLTIRPVCSFQSEDVVSAPTMSSGFSIVGLTIIALVLCIIMYFVRKRIKHQ